MGELLNILVIVASFAIISFSSKQIGHFFAKYKLPLITGFLFTGIITGPDVLQFISLETTKNLSFINDISLAFIAFAAGSELFIHELKNRLRGITFVTIGMVAFTFTAGAMATLFLANEIPFMRDMTADGKLAVAILAGSILVTLSPSSAIAVIKELRAKGSFTQTVLGVTLISEVVVIILFSINRAIADTLLEDLSLNLQFAIHLFLELSSSILLALVLSYGLRLILVRHMRFELKAWLIIALGYGTFVLCKFIPVWSAEWLHIEVASEPLLICMIASFLVANYSPFRNEFEKLLNNVGPYIYVAFFTLTGASLSLSTVAGMWKIALILFGVRALSIMLGTFFGGWAAGDPMKHNRSSWMTYLTQAGISLALAENVALVFPTWGPSFAAMILTIIIFNQVIGPPLFKWAIHLVGESHSRAKHKDVDKERRAIIFGLESHSLALARQLMTSGWHIKIATLNEEDLKLGGKSDVEIVLIPDLTLPSLRIVGAQKADSIVGMLSDADNLKVCGLAYENFGTENMVVYLNDREYFEKFHELGVSIVDPNTAMVGLLDHFVRSPSSAPLLLGRESGRDMIDIEVRDPDIVGMAIRDLKLPLDTVVLSVRRGDEVFVSRGHTELKLGDWVTVVGSLESLEELELKFEM